MQRLMRTTLVALVVLSVWGLSVPLQADTFTHKQTGESFNGYATKSAMGEKTKVYKDDGTDEFVDLSKYKVEVNEKGKPMGAPGRKPIGTIGLGFETLEGADDKTTVVVNSLRPNGPAELGGIEVGDTITHFGGKAVDTSWVLSYRIRRTHPFLRVEVKLIRAGNRKTAMVTVADARKGTTIYPIEIKGSIDMDRDLPGYVKARLAEAKVADAKLIAVHIDSPGGYIHVAKEICAALHDEKIPTVAIIDGKENGALSAAAWIALSCDSIFMMKGSKIGAATPYSIDQTTGDRRVDEKFMSVFRAEFRSLAEDNGYPGAIAEAMIDYDIEIIEVTAFGKKTYVKSDSTVRRDTGRVVCKKGEILTATPQEATDFGIAKAVIESDWEAFAALDIEDPAVDESRYDLLYKKRKLANSTAKKVRAAVQKAIDSDPHKASYKRSTENRRHNDGTVTLMGQFADGGEQWRKNTEKAIKYTSRALKELTKLQELLGKYPELLGWDEFANHERGLLMYRNYLEQNKNSTGLE